MALLALVALVCGDSPRTDESPFWPVSAKWDPALPTTTCALNITTTPNTPATWDDQFTSCVYRLTDFDTCADDACVDAFTASTQLAPNCSYDGTPGTAQEVESFRLARCQNARKIASLRYIPKGTPAAPQCVAAQQAKWNAAYENNPTHVACLQALTASLPSTRSCSDACQVLFRDSVGDAEECLFSKRAGDLTQHEWLKHRLVWCLTVRGETLREEPLLSLRGTPSPAPTTPKPTTVTPVVSNSSSTSESTSGSGSSSASSSGSSTSASGSLENGGTGSVSSSSSGPSASEDNSEATGPPIEIASSFQGEPFKPVANSKRPTYGNVNSAATQRHGDRSLVALVATVRLLHTLF